MQDLTEKHFGDVGILDKYEVNNNNNKKKKLVNLSELHLARRGLHVIRTR